MHAHICTHVHASVFPAAPPVPASPHPHCTAPSAPPSRPRDALAAPSTSPWGCKPVARGVPESPANAGKQQRCSLGVPRNAPARAAALGGGDKKHSNVRNRALEIPSSNAAKFSQMCCVENSRMLKKAPERGNFVSHALPSLPLGAGGWLQP